MDHQRWTLYQLKHTLRKWIACCFLIFPDDVSRYNVHSVNQNIFLWLKKYPLWIWHVTFFVELNKTCLKFWCVIVTDILLISWKFLTLILLLLMTAVVHLIIKFLLWDVNKILDPTIPLVLPGITFLLFVAAVLTSIKTQSVSTVGDLDICWIKTR